MIKNNRLLHILSRQGVTKFFYTFLIASLLSLSACDEESVVGLDVQPTTDLLNVSYTDTVTLVTQTVKEDSLKTDVTVAFLPIGAGNKNVQIAQLGKYIDPIFGATSASFFTSLKQTTTITPTQFGSNPIVDSVVISLVYDTSYYGKRERKMQTVNVYQLTENLSIDKSYYSNTSLTTSSFDLATNKNFIPRPKDSVLVYSKKEKAQLRIKLDNYFGQTILNNQATGNITDNTAIQNFVKGFYITTENSSLFSARDGNIMLFNMEDPLTNFTIFYHNATTDSLKYSFLLNTVPRHMVFKHAYSGTNVDPPLTNQLTSTAFNQNNTVYIQSFAGVKVKIKMPYLINILQEGNIAINKAELVIKADQNLNYQLDTFAAPKALILFGINDDGTIYILPDAFEGSSYYGGSYNTTTKEYRFNISRYVQQLLTDKKNNNGLYLFASGGHLNPNRVVIGGGASGTNQMKLNITYTKLH